MSRYTSLIIAGFGSIGSSLSALPHSTLSSFDHVLAVDRDESAVQRARAHAFTAIRGDITDRDFLTKVLDSVPAPAIFLNLCVNTDNIELRTVIAERDTAYVDTSSGFVNGVPEPRMQRAMPYSYREIKSRRPHLLHFGLNPGVVELVARALMSRIPDTRWDVFIYEHDSLQSEASGRPAVGWSPQGLVEEILLCPSFEIIEGKKSEAPSGPTRKTTAVWEGENIPSRIVGHEEIWNLGMLGTVRNARFVYGLHPAAMRCLDAGPKHSLTMLTVPDAAAGISGTDRIAVQVTGCSCGVSKTLFWSTDHRKTKESLGINAVQFQTGTSVMLALELLQHTACGLQQGSFTASTLPLDRKLQSEIKGVMESHSMLWMDGNRLGLHIREAL